MLSALGRLERADELTVKPSTARWHNLPWPQHAGTRCQGCWPVPGPGGLTDALYVELADRMGVRVLTTNQRLGRASAIAEVIHA